MHVALVKDLSITGTTGRHVREHVSGSSVLRDFAADSNPLSVIVDGAKRDRLVWGGEAIQAAPTVYDTSRAGGVIRGSLRLWGSYRTSAGEAGSDLATGLSPGLTSGENLDELATGHYSLSYSEIWPINLYEYYLYTGDLAFVRIAWSAALGTGTYERLGRRARARHRADDHRTRPRRLVARCPCARRSRPDGSMARLCS